MWAFGDGVIKHGWNKILFPIGWSVGITLFCTLLFMLIRWRRGVSYSVGTDLFAVLLAADIAVALGVVEAWKITSGSTETVYRAAAGLLAFLTMATAWIAVEFEAAANRAHAAALSETQSRVKALLRRDYLDNFVNAYVARLAISSLHIWWVTTTPRWALML